MKSIFFVVLFSLFQLFGFSQVVRFNINDNMIGIQTPHDWNIYAHSEARLFRYGFAPDFLISAFDFQFGYVWFNNKRGTVRSAINNTTWFISPDEKKNVYNYWGLIPIAFGIYPFNREYAGLDLFLEFDPYDLTISPGMTILVRIN
jgi:hypothetical protein